MPLHIPFTIPKYLQKNNEPNKKAAKSSFRSHKDRTQKSVFQRLRMANHLRKDLSTALK